MIRPLIRKLKSEFPAAKQQRLGDDGSTVGKFADIHAQFERRQQLGPNYGYLPDSSKSILVVAPHNVKQAKVEFDCLHFQVETGSRYLGSFIGATRKETVESQTKLMTGYTALKSLRVQANPQSAFSALQRSVQQDGQYLQCKTPNIESCFDLLEKAMQEEFLQALFGEAIVSNMQKSRLPA